MTKDIETSYTAVADYHIRQYDTMYSSTRSMIAFIKERLDYEKPLEILDIGCGGGANIHWLKNEFPQWKFTGIDVDEGAIDLAKKRNPESEFHIIGLEKIDSLFEPRSFDYALGLHFITTSPFNVFEFQDFTLPMVKQGLVVSSLFSEGYIEQETIRRDIINQKEYNYGIYSLPQWEKWCQEHNCVLNYEPFEIDIDLPKPDSEIIQTYTITTAEGKRIQVSPHMLMPWYNVLLSI